MNQNPVGSEGKGCRCFPFPAAPFLGQKNRWEVPLPWGRRHFCKAFSPVHGFCSARQSRRFVNPLFCSNKWDMSCDSRGKTGSVRCARSIGASQRCSWGFFSCFYGNTPLDRQKNSSSFHLLDIHPLPSFGKSGALVKPLDHETLILHLFPSLFLIPPTFHVFFSPSTQK